MMIGFLVLSGYIENRLKGITLLVIVDGAFALFFLSLNINFVLIVIFYTICGWGNGYAYHYIL